MIQREDHGSTAVLRMAKGKGNSLDIAFLEALIAALDEAESSPVRAVVLTAEGSIFGAGVDLPTLLEGGREYADRFLARLCQFVERGFMFPKPLITAVGGHAIAGGCVGALLGDRRIMVRGKATIGLTELLVGVPFPTPVFELVRATVPARYVPEIVYTGKLYTADEALQRGLIDEAVEPEALLPRALEVAESYGRILPETFRITKEQLRRPAVEQWQRYGAELDGRIIAAWSTPAVREAIQSFVAARIKR